MKSQSWLVAGFAALISGLSFAGPVSAQNSQDSQEWKWCARKDGATADQQISGCTTIIQSGREKTSELARAYGLRSWGWQDKGDSQKALADGNQAVRLNPKLAMAYLNRGRALSALGEKDKSIADYDEAIRLDPKFTMAYNNRGVVYKNKGDVARALADYSEAIRLNPKLTLPLNNRALLLASERRYDEAIRDFDASLEIDPGQRNMHLERGLAFHNKKDLDRAIADYNEALRLDPDYAIAFNNRGFAYYNKGDADRAIADYNEALRSDPKYITAMFNRAHAFERKNQYERALPDYDKIIDLQANNATAWSERCWARTMSGQLKAGLNDCNEAIRLRSNYANGLENRGFVQLMLNRIDDAIASYDAALRLEPKKSFALYGRGTAKTQKGDVNGARADIAAATELRATIAADFGRFATRSGNPQTQVAVVTPPPPAPSKVIPAPPPPLPNLPADTGGRRVALVIGNGAYVNANPLPNPANDARDVAAALRNLGFVVIEGIDVDGAAMRRKIAEFGSKMTGASTTLLFYAGHGMQVAGENYLVPTDARLERPSSLGVEAIDVKVILADMESEKRVNLVFLDACRDNPLSRSLARSMGSTRSANIGQGLAQLNAGIGTLITFATSPDTVALDGTGRNSPFTTALLRHIRTPHLEVRSMLTRVRADVIQMTHEKQIPWDHSSLTGDFFFVN
jgi:tetratricopeptide (TPR) repeat protein